ncbi:MAG: monovalent cation/H(+) antiporter subunit G [Dehalococcoidia bacterium]|nr:monovalent cation/H(+) antiporter subunit G [Dehalococcoidia bacterium]
MAGRLTIVIADVLTVIFVLIGCFFLLVVTIGIFRLPDAFSRLHLTSKSDPIGTVAILVAAAIYGGWSSDILRLIAIGSLLVITSVTSSHAIGRSALNRKAGNLRGGPTPGREEENAAAT